MDAGRHLPVRVVSPRQGFPSSSQFRRPSRELSRLLPISWPRTPRGGERPWPPPMEDGCRRRGCRLGGPSGPARPLLPSLSPSGSKRALARPPRCRGRKRWVQRATPGVMASSSGGGSTCLAWNGSDGRNSGGRDAPLPGLLGGSWVGRDGMSDRCTEAGVGRGAPEEPSFHVSARPCPCHPLATPHGAGERVGRAKRAKGPGLEA